METNKTNYISKIFHLTFFFFNAFHILVGRTCSYVKTGCTKCRPTAKVKIQACEKNNNNNKMRSQHQSINGKHNEVNQGEV